MNTQSSNPPSDKILKKAGPESYISDENFKMAGPIEIRGNDKSNHKLSSKSDKDPEKCRFLFLLRNIRVEFQTIHDSFSKLIELNSSPDKKKCSVETEEIHEGIYKRCSKVIDSYLAAIDGLFEKNPCISEHSDTVQTIKEGWNLVKELFNDYTENHAKKADILNKCKQCLENAVYLCNIITVPSRVEDHLNTLKAGYALDFYEELKEEFFSEEQAKDVFKYLARHPAFIDDIIDPSKGLIFKVDPRNERWKSYARTFGAFLLGVGAVGGSFWFFREQISQDLTSFLKFYLIFVCGALFHIFIDAMKSTKSSTGLNFKSVDDWFLWVNIKELSIITGIILLDFTFIGLALILSENEFNTITLAAAGYSFDSIGEIIYGRFELILSKKEVLLKNKISST